jgi:hypothetical protein
MSKVPNQSCFLCVHHYVCKPGDTIDLSHIELMRPLKPADFLMDMYFFHKARDGSKDLQWEPVPMKKKRKCYRPDKAPTEWQVPEDAEPGFYTIAIRIWKKKDYTAWDYHPVHIKVEPEEEENGDSSSSAEKGS